MRERLFARGLRREVIFTFQSVEQIELPVPLGIQFAVGLGHFRKRFRLADGLDRPLNVRAFHQFAALSRARMRSRASGLR